MVKKKLPNGRLKKLGKQGNLIRVGPPPSFFDDFDYDDCLAERRYFLAETERVKKARAALNEIDPRGCWFPELKKIDDDFEGMLKTCRIMILGSEKRMVALTKAGDATK